MQKIFKTLLVVLMSMATSSLFAYTGDKMNKSENNSLADWQQQCREGFTSKEWTLGRDMYLDELVSNLSKEAQQLGFSITFTSDKDAFDIILQMKEVTLYNFESFNGYVSLDYKKINYTKENSGPNGVNYIVLPMDKYYLVVAKVNCYNLQLGIVKIPEVVKPVVKKTEGSSAPASATATVGDVNITIIDSTKGGDTYVTNNYITEEKKSSEYVPQGCGNSYGLGYDFGASASIDFGASCAPSYNTPVYCGPRGGGGYVSGGGSNSSVSNSYNTTTNYYSNTTTTNTTNINYQSWYWNWTHSGGGTASNDSGPHNPGGGGPGNPGGGIGYDTLPHNPNGRLNGRNPGAYVSNNQPSSSRNGRESADPRVDKLRTILAVIDAAEQSPRGAGNPGQGPVPRNVGHPVEGMTRGQQQSAENTPSLYSSPRQEPSRSNPVYSNESRVRNYRQQPDQQQYSPAPREDRNSNVSTARAQNNVNPYAVPVPSEPRMQQRQQMQAPMMQQRSMPAPSYGGGGRQGRVR